MKKFQERVQKIGVVLMLIFPVCLLIVLLCSDYQTENEHRLYVEIQEFFVNWNTFTISLVGMLFYSIGWFTFPEKKKRPTTF